MSRRWITSTFSGAAKDGRFGLVYVFNSRPHRVVGGKKSGTPRLILRVFIDEQDIEVESLVPLYAEAREWLEREVAI